MYSTLCLSLFSSSSLLCFIAASYSFYFLSFSYFCCSNFYYLSSSLSCASYSRWSSIIWCFRAASSSRRFSSSFLALAAAASASDLCYLRASSRSFFSSASLRFLSTSASLLLAFCLMASYLSSFFYLILLSCTSFSIMASTSFFYLALIFSIALSSCSSIDDFLAPACEVFTIDSGELTFIAWVARKP